MARAKRVDDEVEFLGKIWDQWARLLMRGKDPEPMLWPLIHWAKHVGPYDRKIAGPPPQPRHLRLPGRHDPALMDGRARPKPHERSDPINGWLDWTGQARTDDPAELAAALEAAGLSLEDYLAA